MYFRAVSGTKQFGENKVENPEREDKCEQSNDNSATLTIYLNFKKVLHY